MSGNNIRMRLTLLLLTALTMSFATPVVAAKKKNVTVRTEHSEDPKEISGQITAVKIGKTEVVVNSQAFSIPRSTKITVNGAPSMLMYVKVGDQARVGYTTHTITTIRSSGKSKSGSRSSKTMNTGGKDQSIEADSLTVTQQ